MPKLIKPSHGERAQDVIQGFYGFEDKPPVAEPLHLIGLVGKRVCCEQSQAGNIRVGIDKFRLLKRMTDENGDPTREFIEAQQTLAAAINTFRLDCGDCLNDKCPHRDPDFPVEEVQKRAKIFDITGKPIKLEEEV